MAGELHWLLNGGVPAPGFQWKWKSLVLYTIISINDKGVKQHISFGGGENKLMPVSVQSDQLLCLPEPLTPLNGFVK